MATTKSTDSFVEGVHEITNDPDHHEAADALAALLSGVASAEDTAKSITMMYEVSLKKSNESTWEDERNKPFYFWGLHMWRAIRAFGDDEVQARRLLDLLEEMSRQPDVINSDGSVKLHAELQIYWRDLPGWSFHLMEMLDYNHPSVFIHGDEDTFLAQGPKLLNGTKFAAGLLERGKCVAGLPMKAFNVLFQALEQNYDDTFGEAMLQLERHILLPAAATWVLVAGQAIYNHCVDEGDAQLDTDAEAHKQWTELNLSRQQWTNWKTRFGDLATSRDMSVECRDFASRAVSRMTEIEGRHQV